MGVVVDRRPTLGFSERTQHSFILTIAKSVVLAMKSASFIKINRAGSGSLGCVLEPRPLGEVHFTTASVHHEAVSSNVGARTGLNFMHHG